MRRNKSVETNAQEGSEVAAKPEPKSLAVARKGIKTAGDFGNMMSALMSDLIEGRVTPNVGNATCNAGGKLLKCVELSYKYGTESPNKPQRKLILAVEEAS